MLEPKIPITDPKMSNMPSFFLYSPGPGCSFSENLILLFSSPKLKFSCHKKPEVKSHKTLAPKKYRSRKAPWFSYSQPGHSTPSSLSLSIPLPKLQTIQIHALCLSLPLTAEARWYLVPPPVTLVSDGADQSGDWKRQVSHSKVCQPQGRVFQSQLPPVGRGCPQRTRSGRGSPQREVCGL